MLREVKVNTLEGGDFTVEVTQTNTIEEFKAILLEKKHCEDSSERKILKVKVLTDALLDDDGQTLESAGLLHSKLSSVIYFRHNDMQDCVIKLGKWYQTAVAEARGSFFARFFSRKLAEADAK